MSKTVYHIEWMEYRSYSANFQTVDTEDEAVEICKRLFALDQILDADEFSKIKTLEDIEELRGDRDLSEYAKYYPVVIKITVDDEMNISVCSLFV